MNARIPIVSFPVKCGVAAMAMSLVVDLSAALRLPRIIGDHMVLQQKQSNPLWGWDAPGTTIEVAFAGTKQTAVAGPDGRWTVRLDPRPASFTPQEIVIRGTETRTVRDVLIGEVWMCSGQSNMAYRFRQGVRDGDLESLAFRLPGLRLLRVQLAGTQELCDDIAGGEWAECTPERSRDFSAVGLFFGRYIHQIVNAPVGLIDNSWGGSMAEAWVRRSSLEGEPRFRPLMARTAQREAYMQTEQAWRAYETELAKWREARDAAQRENRPSPLNRTESPESWLKGSRRPANIFNGMVLPTRGYGIRGVIWYQGEGNVSRAYEHRELFPFLIEQWRKEWGQGDFPFYWVQLADFRPEKAEPGESALAELRETQTKALALPHTGQAVVIDLGESKFIHPLNKHDTATRLVRWALTNDYGFKLACRSPELRGVEFSGQKATVTLDCFGSRLRPFDVEEAVGFAVCGADRVWRWAKGRVLAPDRVEVWSDQVAAPVAVRYAWADNPVCNLYSVEGLPVTPFRTDDFEMTTKP
jgi:sialate O-acetylesterase